MNREDNSKFKIQDSKLDILPIAIGFNIQNTLEFKVIA